MMTPFVLEVRAESACRLLNLTIGLHRTGVSAPRSNTRPVSRLASPAFDGLQMQRQGTLLRMLSITEHFCADRLLDLAEQEVQPSNSRVRSHMWDRTSAGAIGTWEGIQNSYKQWYAINPGWTRLNQLVEVRNAIAHGLGSLTRLQLAKRQSAVTKITDAGVRLEDDRIVLEEANLDHARKVCVDLITDIDASVQGLPPRI